MNKQKIVTSINSSQIREAKESVNNYLVLLDRAKDKVKELTDGNVVELDMDLVDAYLNSLTGFKNGSMSATAYNLQDVYNEFKTLINEVEDGTHNLQFISKGKVNDTKIEEANTSYLRDKHIEEYLRIKEAVDVLNESSMFVLRTVLNLKGNKIHFTPQSFEFAKSMR